MTTEPGYKRIELRFTFNSLTDLRYKVHYFTKLFNAAPAINVRGTFKEIKTDNLVFFESQEGAVAKIQANSLLMFDRDGGPLFSIKPDGLFFATLFTDVEAIGNGNR